MDFRALFHPFDFFCYLLIMKKIWNCIILKNPIVIRLSEKPSKYDQEKNIPNILQKFHIYGNVNKYVCSSLFSTRADISIYNRGTNWRRCINTTPSHIQTPDPNHFLILELTN